MKRIALVLLLLATMLASTVTAGASASAVSCDGTHMAMVNGKYTTCVTLQQGAHFENMDAWSPDPTLQQAMHVTSFGHWSVTISEPDASNPRVVTYPDDEARFTTYEDCTHSPDWSTLHHLSSRWAMSSPDKGDWDQAYDMFFGGTIAGYDCGQFQEVMIYTKWHGNVYAPTALANFTTSDGQNYGAYWSADHSYIQVRMTTQADAGTVNIKQVLRALAKLSVLDRHGLIHFVKHGVEVVSGQDTAAAGALTFKRTAFSVTAN